MHLGTRSRGARTLVHVQYLQHNKGNLVSSHTMTSNDAAGKCAMRASCGKKGFFGKPLPCPYDGPAVEVHLLALPM